MSWIKDLADTNCFIYLLDQNPTILSFAQEGWAYSYITEIELLSKKGITQNEDAVIREVLESCFKIAHYQPLTELFISLKRNYKIKLPHAIIAAYARLLQIPLITADKGFSSHTDLDCIIFDCKIHLAMLFKITY